MISNMNRITSRKNKYIMHLRALSRDRAYRVQSGEFLCDGSKLFKEALTFNAKITSVLWKENFPADADDCADCAGVIGLGEDIAQYTAPGDLFDYASPMPNSPGPLFTVRIPDKADLFASDKILVLENVQDPGNVGTVIRTANAFGIDAVIMTGNCADLYSPKTVRATMGAIFRQKVAELDLNQLKIFTEKNSLPLYGAVLSSDAVDITELNLEKCAVAVGSEGQGLSRDLIELCSGKVIIPMNPESESLNAAVAASVIMWEMRKFQ